MALLRVLPDRNLRSETTQLRNNPFSARSKNNETKYNLTLALLGPYRLYYIGLYGFEWFETNEIALKVIKYFVTDAKLFQ